MCQIRSTAGQNPALTVLYVPYSLDIGRVQFPTRLPESTIIPVWMMGTSNLELSIDCKQHMDTASTWRGASAEPTSGRSSSSLLLPSLELSDTKVYEPYMLAST